MQAAYSARAVRAAEGAHAAELDSGELMARAAWALAMGVVDELRLRGIALVGARVVLAVGGGNNGGDALHAGALLAARGLDVRAIMAATHCHAAGAAALIRRGGRIIPWSGNVERARAWLAAADVVVDGMVGIGGRPGSSGLSGAAAEIAQALADGSAAVVAVDVPSGIDADAGGSAGVHVRADRTVTFACLKPGLLLEPGRSASGVVQVADIGIDDALVNAGPPACRVLDRADVLELWPRAQPDDHKYRRGVVGIAAGSSAYPGAAVLTVQAAARSGVGMVVLWDRGLPGLADACIAVRPDAVPVSAPPVEQPRVSAWACGPGLTLADGDAVAAVLATDRPAVLDAGALACLADRADLRAAVRARPAATVITPHDGEARVLATACGWTPTGDRLADARRLATDLGCIVLWKGPGTVVIDGTVFVSASDPVSDAVSDAVPWVDCHGGPELACAGSGDVLTGLLGGLLAGLAARDDGVVDPARASVAAAWVHADAGRRAAAVGGAVTALDLISGLNVRD